MSTFSIFQIASSCHKPKGLKKCKNNWFVSCLIGEQEGIVVKCISVRPQNNNWLNYDKDIEEKKKKKSIDIFLSL